jgi:hypothetical protein
MVEHGYIEEMRFAPLAHHPMSRHSVCQNETLATWMIATNVHVLSCVPIVNYGTRITAIAMRSFLRFVCWSSVIRDMIAGSTFAMLREHSAMTHRNGREMTSSLEYRI